MAAPLGLYEIFADPDHRSLIKAYCLENILTPRLDYAGIQALWIDRIPPRPITWHDLPLVQEDEVIMYGGYADFEANALAFDMQVYGIGLAYENLEEGLFWSLGYRKFATPILFQSLQQRLRATIVYTVMRLEE